MHTQTPPHPQTHTHMQIGVCVCVCVCVWQHTHHKQKVVIYTADRCWFNYGKCLRSRASHFNEPSHFKLTRRIHFIFDNSAIHKLLISKVPFSADIKNARKGVYRIKKGVIWSLSKTAFDYAFITLSKLQNRQNLKNFVRLSCRISIKSVKRFLCGPEKCSFRNLHI